MPVAVMASVLPCLLKELIEKLYPFGSIDAM